MAEHPPQNAASNLLADLSKMLAGPTSADGTVRRGNPGDNDPVLAMKPVPSPVYGTSPKGNGMAAASSSNMATPQPAPRRPSQGLDLSGSSTETVVAYALKALTEEFLGKVDLMTQSFQKMEDRLDKMEQKVEQHTMAVNALSASADKNFETLGSTVREIVRSVQLLKDKQELFDAQQEIARATVTAKGGEALAEPEPQEESGEATEPSALSDLDSSEEEEEALERARKKGKGKLRRTSLKKQRARAATAPASRRSRRCCASGCGRRATPCRRSTTRTTTRCTASSSARCSPAPRATSRRSTLSSSPRCMRRIDRTPRRSSMRGSAAATM